jgi:hypothetical protein
MRSNCQDGTILLPPFKGEGWRIDEGDEKWAAQVPDERRLQL